MEAPNDSYVGIHSNPWRPAKRIARRILYYALRDLNPGTATSGSDRTKAAEAREAAEFLASQACVTICEIAELDFDVLQAWLVTHPQGISPAELEAIEADEAKGVRNDR